MKPIEYFVTKFPIELELADLRKGPHGYQSLDPVPENPKACATIDCDHWVDTPGDYCLECCERYYEE
jgi:hypothetical protein